MDKKRWIEKKSISFKMIIFTVGGIILITAGGAMGYFLVTGQEEEISYREETVLYGELTVGMQESGNVEVGTTEQTFELDLSAYTSSSSDTFSWNTNLFAGMGNVASSSSSSGRNLTVEEILVTEGQEITEGEPIYRITQESIDSIRSELSSDVSDALVTLEQTQTQLQMTRLEAQQAYETDTAYGTDLAQAEYNKTVSDLQEAVTDIEEEITDVNEELLTLNEQLAEYQADLETEQEVLENAEYVIETTDIVSDAYGWITAENAREDAQEVIDQLEDEIETTTESIEESNIELAELTESLTGAQKDLEQGLIDAQAQLSLRTLKNSNASERYDVSVAMGEFDTQVAQEDYDEASEKLEEFDSVLGEGTLNSQYNGVVTQIELSIGDAVDTGTVLITLNDYDEVTVTVSVEESELENINEGDAVNVSISAYPDEEFTGTVEEIGDSEYDSSTGNTYADVTVKLSGDTAKLYEGMSVEITFITKETETVTYVSNRAVYRQNGKSYVRKKEADGSITEQEVVTGFSDGTYVEIEEGLSEGDTVLIESRVSDS